MCVCEHTDLRWLWVYVCSVSVCVCEHTDLRWLRVHVCEVSVCGVCAGH